MTTLLYVEFTYNGPFGREMSLAFRDLAESIVREPGLIKKYWTENRETNKAGGVYLFESRQQAEIYFAMHAARLQTSGVTDITGRYFDVNESLTAATTSTD